MSEKPQADPGGKRADLLEQVFIRGLNKMDAPAQIMMSEDDSTEKTHPSPQREDGSKAEPTASRKNRSSAVYLYLLILFGAAFLMLLLAYFVQQRNKENTVSDPHNSMSLSWEELPEDDMAFCFDFQ